MIPEEGCPVLLQIHGGAWMMGDKGSQALPLMYELASRGWICVAANYRLSPSVGFPTHLHDCKAALCWVRTNGREYGMNPDFVAVTGGSAGGHLTALMGLTANRPELQPGQPDVDTSVQAAIPFYGVYDWTHDADRHFGPRFRSMLGRLVMQTPYEKAPDLFREASPIHRIHPDLPPFLVVHGDRDSLAPVEGAREFVARLQQTSKSPVGFAELPGAQHAFEIFHSLRCRDAVLGVADFLEGVHADHRSGRTPEGRAARSD